MMPWKKLGHFNGGLHLEQHKEQSLTSPVAMAKLPKKLYIPMQQHIGSAAEPIVSVGEKVRKAQIIAKATDYISAAIHAPSSGTVIAIEDHPVAHPSGKTALCIVIKTDGKENWRWRKDPSPDFLNIDPSALRNIIREAGIVGLGGAGFPSFIKMNPGYNNKISTLILNGAECEPYITCDAKIMQDHAREIIDGLLIIRHALQAEKCIIALEDNKPQAFKTLVDTLNDDELKFITIQRIPTIYPTGGEKQLIKVLINKEIPSGGLPIDLNVSCHNVATALAVYRAVAIQEPLISRYVTVTGDGIKDPKNLEVLIGTPIYELLQQCKINYDNVDEIIIGGPMMGFNLQNEKSPVIKTTNCILTLKQKSDTKISTMPCIRCGECARVCPAQLVPQQLYWYAKAKDFDGTQKYNLFDCIECGCCAYVCPSQIPLVQYYRYAKTEIYAQERITQKSTIARERHEFHELRLEREKIEKAEKLRKKKELLKNKKSATKSPSDTNSETNKTKTVKNDLVAQAMARLQQKRDTQKEIRQNVSNLTPEQQKAIKEIDKRRKEQREEKIKKAHENNNDINKEMVKK
ncbi:MAG: electron transport complex subunit RsxC [Thiohalomonadales bacterium]